jgi:hypothetical protein
MGIAILPYEMKGVRCLASIPQCDLIWPLESSDRTGTIADLRPEDHLVVSPSSRRLYYPAENLHCSVSLRITEPYAVHRRHYMAMYAMWPRFYRIFSRCKTLAKRIPNARALTLTTTWVTDQHCGDSKSKRMSLIASNKKKLRGQRLRHEIADWIPQSKADVDLLGRAYHPVDRKEDALAPYQYSVVIENSREANYFSEKLIDCFLCNTVPIYWGAADVDQYFDAKGMIICQDIDELQNAIENLTEDDYQRLSQFAAANRRLALSYINQELAIANLIQSEIVNVATSTSYKLPPLISLEKARC